MDHLFYLFILGLVYCIAFIRGRACMQEKIKNKIKDGISKIPKNNKETTITLKAQVTCEEGEINLDSIYFFKE